MYRYIVIDENGFIVGESHLSGIIDVENNILVDDDFDTTNKRYVNGEWVEYIPPEPPEWEKDLIDENTEAQLEMQANIQYLVDLAEIDMEEM